MMSKSEAGKKSRNVSESGKLIKEIDSINKALYSEKDVRRSSAGCSSRGKSMGDGLDSIPKAKPFWDWKKPLKALSHARSRRFNCCFSLQVHTIEGLPSTFNGSSLLVHWKRRDWEVVTAPAKAFHGVAEFQEQLAHICSVHASRSGPHHSAKYEAKLFMLYTTTADGIDLGKHRLDLTRLLPLTFEELEDDKSSAKWTTTFKLQGNAAGAVMNVSFRYVLLPDNPFLSPNNKILLQRLSSKHNSSTPLNSPPSHSLPESKRPFDNSYSVDDIKVLHEVLPSTSSSNDLSDSLMKLDIMLQEEPMDPSFNDDPAIAVSEYQFDSAQCSLFCPDSLKENVVCGDADLSSCDKVLENSIEEKTPCNEQTTATHDCDVENSVISKACSNIGTSLEGDHITYLQKLHDIDIKESIIYDGNSEEKDTCTQKSVLKELEFAFNAEVDLEKAGLGTPQAESELGDPKNYVEENKSNSVEMSLSLEDLESAESEFLNLLRVGDARIDCDGEGDGDGEGEPESPRERLLREFERETEFSGYSLFGNFVEEEEEEYEYDAPRVREWESLSEDYEQASIMELSEEHYITHQLGTSNASTLSRLENCADDFELASVSEAIEDRDSASQAAGWRPRAKVLEDLETEELMREWGLNEKTFESPPPDCLPAFGSQSELTHQDSHVFPALGEGLGPSVQTKNGGFLRSMNPALFMNLNSGGRLIMQVSSPVVVPADMGSGVMEVLENMASLGLERLSAQANKLMPLEDITGQTMQQISWEAESPQLDINDRQDSGSVASGGHKESRRRSSRLKSHAGTRNGELGSEYVDLEDLAPLAMDKIEAVSMEGLKIQCGLSEEEAPCSIRPKSLSVEGAVGLQLLDVRDNSASVDGLMGLSLTLDEWMRIDSGEIEEDEMKSERTSKILAAHHACSAELSFRGRGRRRSSKAGLFGNNFTVALMVQLRDPLRDYEPVGTPMLALIQVERVFVPPKPKVYSSVSEANKNHDEDEEEPETLQEAEPELVPQYKVGQVHVAGLKTQLGKKVWGTAAQQQSGSRWLLANGMGKQNKQPFLKTKPAAKSSSQATTVSQSGDTLWSISTQIHGTGSKWKDLVSLNPHIRNPNLVIPTGSVIRIR